MTIIMLGPPGSGKDTQAQLLAQKHGFTVISPGEALREAAAQGDTEIESYIAQGNLVPDLIVDRVLRDYVQRRGNLAQIIFTGIPRRVEQVVLMDSLVEAIGQQLHKVVYLGISDAEVIERVSGRLYAPNSDHYYHIKFNPPKVAGRDDDTGEPLIRRPDDAPEAVQQRLKVFHTEMGDVLAAYRQRGQLLEINGAQEISEVARSIEAALDLANHV